MSELAFIEAVKRIFPRASNQKNAINESDCELLELKGETWGFNIDQYSEEEDFFPSSDPESLGYNLVAATLSDLLASGVEPRFFMHACVLPRGNTGFAEPLLKGISIALKEANCQLIGGDTSCSEKWSYTGVAFGKAERPVLRSGAKHGDIIYSTGLFGHGNRNGLLLSIPNNGADHIIKDILAQRFPLRIAAAKVIQKHASFAIDSSDGYFTSFRHLAAANPRSEFKINFSRELIDPVSLASINRAKLPEELLLLSSLGEYELIFGVPPQKESALLTELQSINETVVRLGTVESETPGVTLKTAKGIKRIPSDKIPDPRSMTPQQYIQTLIGLVHAYL